jgi:outer membrane protein OmpA-like peptidoglycan-associated protein
MKRGLQMKITRLISPWIVLLALAVPALSWQNSDDSSKTNSYPARLEERTTKAVDYRQGSTSEVDLKATNLMPEAKGEAKVHSRTGRIEIEAKLDHLRPANTLGLEYLTYVLWAIGPDGRPNNLGEMVLHDKDEASIQTTTGLQAFALIVTAEPYYAVSQPSDMVIAENDVKDAKGFVRTVDVQYELIPHTLYSQQVEPIEKPVYGVDKKVPLSLLEARNAVRIAKDAQAEEYAQDGYQSATKLLTQAEDYYSRKQGSKAIDTVAREAVQAAESARIMALKAEQSAKLEQQRREEQARTEQAQADAAAQAQAAQQAQADREAAARQAAEAQARAQAEAQQRQEAELAAQQQAQQAQQLQAQAQQAQQAQQQAQQQAEQAQQQAQQAQLQAQQAQQQAQQTRARLMDQLNQVLQTRDSARGLIVSMPDVLFDTGSANLRSTARERLAKVAGILIAYPDIHVEVDGYTDSTGSDAFNQQLSQQRSDSVRDYLASQGVSQSVITTRGFGESDPIASNDTASGRQQNRRVEMVVSGQSIGAQAGETTAPPSQ